MTDGQVVSLGGDRSCKSPAEGVDHRWEPTGGLRGLLEVLTHQSARVTGQKGELLVLRHGVVTCAKELGSDLCVVVRLAVAASGRLVEGNSHRGSMLLAIRLEKHR